MDVDKHLWAGGGAAGKPEQHISQMLWAVQYISWSWVLLLLGEHDSRDAQWLLTKFCPNTDT